MSIPLREECSTAKFLETAFGKRFEVNKKTALSMRPFYFSLSIAGKSSGTIDKCYLDLLRSREAGYKAFSKNLVFDYVLIIK